MAEIEGTDCNWTFEGFSPVQDFDGWWEQCWQSKRTSPRA